MVAEPIEAIPVDALPDKRGPGRPPGKKGELSQNPAAIAARERRANAKASGTKKTTTRKRAPSRGPKSLRTELAATLTMLNMALLMSPLGTRPIGAQPGDPEMVRYGDELDVAEINALAAAIDAQCQRSTRFRKAVEKFLTAGAGGQLVTVAAMIGVRRASRHGIAPPMLDPMIGALLEGGDLETLGALMPTEEPDTTPDPDSGEVPPPRADPGFSFDDL